MPVLALDLYEGCYKMATSVTPASEAKRLEELRWREKLTTRLTVTAAFVERDRIERERRYPKNSG
jgi:hypothetical protein